MSDKKKSPVWKINGKQTAIKRTISKELHKQWRELERQGDSAKLATRLSVSKPTIDKALIYGCCHQDRIVKGITKYFLDRISGEDEAAKMLQDARLEAKA